MQRFLAWIRSPIRMWKIYVLGKCPNCNQYSLGFGQWNDGSLAGKPFCFKANCPGRKHD